MSVQRTTERHRARGKIRIGAFVACVAILFGAAGIRADDVDVDLSLESSAHGPQLPPDLVVTGTWPDRCVPSVTGTDLEPGRIDIRLRVAPVQCRSAPTPFSLRLNPATENRWSRLPLGVYEVRLFLQRGMGDTTLIAARLLDFDFASRAPIPENGFWWSVAPAGGEPSLAGSGLSLERQGADLAIGLLTYEAGGPSWRFGSARLVGSVARVNLMRMSGGGEPFDAGASAPNAEPDLAINLQFLGPTHARAQLVRSLRGMPEGIQIQELAFVRVPFAAGHPAQAWRGRWVLARDDDAAARTFELSTASTRGTEYARLTGDDGALVLDCRLIDLGGHLIPDRCSLIDAGVPTADFDRVGIDRLAGVAADGTRVQLLRLSR